MKDSAIGRRLGSRHGISSRSSVKSHVLELNRGIISR